MQISNESKISNIRSNDRRIALEESRLQLTRGSIDEGCLVKRIGFLPSVNSLFWSCFDLPMIMASASTERCFQYFAIGDEIVQLEIYPGSFKAAQSLLFDSECHKLHQVQLFDISNHTLVLPPKFEGSLNHFKPCSLLLRDCMYTEIDSSRPNIHSVELHYCQSTQFTKIMSDVKSLKLVDMPVGFYSSFLLSSFPCLEELVMSMVCITESSLFFPPSCRKLVLRYLEVLHDEPVRITPLVYTSTTTTTTTTTSSSSSSSTTTTTTTTSSLDSGSCDLLSSTSSNLLLLEELEIVNGITSSHMDENNDDEDFEISVQLDPLFRFSSLRSIKLSGSSPLHIECPGQGGFEKLAILHGISYYNLFTFFERLPNGRLRSPSTLRHLSVHIEHQIHPSDIITMDCADHPFLEELEVFLHSPLIQTLEITNSTDVFHQKCLRSVRIIIPQGHIQPSAITFSNLSVSKITLELASECSDITERFPDACFYHPDEKEETKEVEWRFITAAASVPPFCEVSCTNLHNLVQFSCLCKDDRFLKFSMDAVSSSSFPSSPRDFVTNLQESVSIGSISSVCAKLLYFFHRFEKLIFPIVKVPSWVMTNTISSQQQQQSESHQKQQPQQPTQQQSESHQEQQQQTQQSPQSMQQEQQEFDLGWASRVVKQLEEEFQLLADGYDQIVGNCHSTMTRVKNASNEYRAVGEQMLAFTKHENGFRPLPKTVCHISTSANNQLQLFKGRYRKIQKFLEDSQEQNVRTFVQIRACLSSLQQNAFRHQHNLSLLQKDLYQLNVIIQSMIGELIQFLNQYPSIFKEQFKNQLSASSSIEIRNISLSVSAPVLTPIVQVEITKDGEESMTFEVYLCALLHPILKYKESLQQSSQQSFQQSFQQTSLSSYTSLEFMTEIETLVGNICKESSYCEVIASNIYTEQQHLLKLFEFLTYKQTPSTLALFNADIDEFFSNLQNIPKLLNHSDQTK